MRYTVIVTAVVTLFSAPAIALTIDEAVTAGLKNNAEMQASRLEEEAARGHMARAKLPSFSNPTIEGTLSSQRRPPGEPGGSFRNDQIGLSQSVEVAGQRGLRIDAAARNTERSRFEVRDLERKLRADIRDRFVETLFLRDREILMREYLHIQEELAGLVKVKHEAGDVAALEVNLSQVELARVRRDGITVSTEYRNSLLSLRNLIGIPGDSTLTVDGDLADGLSPLPDKDALAGRASSRVDILAAGAETKRSEAAQKLARREAIPNVTWGVFTGRTEGGSETGATLGLTIPLFDRKQGERIETKARASQARIREAGLVMTSRKEMEEAYAAAASSLEELDLFRRDILGRANENIDLLQLAFKEGKVSFYDVRVAQRETIDMRNAYLQALLAGRRAYNALERAIGGELR